MMDSKQTCNFVSVSENEVAVKFGHPPKLFSKCVCQSAHLIFVCENLVIALHNIDEIHSKMAEPPQMHF